MSKRIVSIFLLFILCFCSTACKKNNDISFPKEAIVISSSKIDYEKEDYLEWADLIVQGTITKKCSEIMTNPDGTRVDANGEIITNRQITEYTFEISQLYKGAHDSNILTVKTTNGEGLTPELILYGEDESTYLSSPLERIDLEVGKECILLLVYVEASYEERTGYFPAGGISGYFPKDENGNYTNSGDNTFSLSPQTIAQEIAVITS